MKLKTQKATVSILSGLILTSLCMATVLYIKKQQNSIVPNSIQFKINNADFQNKLEPLVQKIIADAKQNHTNRTHLISNLFNLLQEYESLDKYSLRLGFDKKLIIEAHVQNPVLAIHTKSKDVYILGSGMKLMDKNPKNSVQNIPSIYMDDTNITKKNESNLNYSWLLEQVNLINENYKWYNTDVQKITWTQAEGFMLTFADNSDAAQNSLFTVYLGHMNLDQKVQKFKSIASVLKQKQFQPHVIDLNLLDRAFIK